MVDIADLNTDIDITVSAPEDYQSNSVPLLPIGPYTLRIVDYAFEPAKSDKKPPVLVLKRVEVADGPFEGRTIGGWQRVYATPFDRKDPSTGEVSKASGLADLLLGLDNTFDTANMTIPIVNQFLRRVVDERATFRAKLDWEGFDKDHSTQLRQEKNVPVGEYKSADAKAIEAVVKFRGKAFNGKQSLVSLHSGNTIEAQVRIANVYLAKN